MTAEAEEEEEEEDPEGDAAAAATALLSTWVLVARKGYDLMLITGTGFELLLLFFFCFLVTGSWPLEHGRLLPMMHSR
uniref:Wssv170 n=1 Tax=White spot syndrome virus TaxID=342409 RepID=A0A3G5BHL0_9VIRU|nr:wssv170 [White spot syndrome virus]